MFGVLRNKVRRAEAGRVGWAESCKAGTEVGNVEVITR